MMYYTTVSGWMVSYFGRFLTGKFYSGMPAEDASAVFGQLLSDPVEMGILDGRYRHRRLHRLLVRPAKGP